MIMTRFFSFVLIACIGYTNNSVAQNLTGIWRGYFITDNMLQYRYEVQMEQTSKSTLSGVTYSYLGKSFYGKTSMTGSFKSVSGSALIQEIKTIEVKMSLGSVACIQKCLLTYTRSGREEFLEGTFTSVFEKTDSSSGYIKGENCGGGRMYLRKVVTSDFYIEPFLRKKNLPKTDVPAITENKPVKPPVNNKPSTVTKTPQQNQKTNKAPQANNTIVGIKPKTDSIAKTEVPLPKNEPLKNLTVKLAMKPAILTQRQNDLLQTLTITSEQVIVKLYDNGEIDDDTISVYLDNQLILSKKRLTASALTINLKMDEDNPEHELIMVAENLGRIPPNTSLMVVLAGDKRYEVRITSTEQKNAMVRFRYIKP